MKKEASNLNKLNLRSLSADRQVWIAAASFALICSILQFWRLQSLTASMDQGIFYQVLWNTLHGHPFESTLSSQLSTNVVHSGELPRIGYQRLGQHFTPILILWAPLVGLLGKWSLPIIQVLLITAAGLILYELGNAKLEKNISKMITFSFYGANAVIGPCLGNFTDLSQLPLCIFILILGIEKRIKSLIIISTFVIPLIREDAGILLIGVCLWVIFRKKSQIKLGAIIGLYGMLWVLATTNIFMPFFSEDSSKRFMVENFGQYLKGQDKASTIEVIKFISQQPVLVLEELISPFGKTIRYLAGHGLPLVFIPFISIDSWLLMGIPLTGILLAQGNPLAINWRYTYLVVPGLFSGAVYWWETHTLTFNRRIFKRIWSGFIILSMFFTLTSNPNRTLSWMIPISIKPWVYQSPIKQWQHGQSALEAIKIIPTNESASASSSLVPHLAARQALIRFPYNTSYQERDGTSKKVDWVAIDLDEHARYAFAFRSEWRDLQEIIKATNALIIDYSPQLVKDGIIILKLNGPENKKAALEFDTLLEKVSKIKNNKL